MEGIYFYWFCWLVWIIVTFILPRGNMRILLAIWILLTIIVSNLYITIDVYEISISYLFIVFGGFVLLATLPRKGLHIFSAITIMIGYTSLLIWEANAPVWIFMPRLLILPLICVLLTTMVNKLFVNRLALSIVGLCGGEFLYSLLLANYSIKQTIGDLLFLDVLLISLILLILIETLKKTKERVLLFFS